MMRKPEKKFLLDETAELTPALQNALALQDPAARESALKGLDTRAEQLREKFIDQMENKSLLQGGALVLLGAVSIAMTVPLLPVSIGLAGTFTVMATLVGGWSGVMGYWAHKLGQYQDHLEINDVVAGVKEGLRETPPAAAAEQSPALLAKIATVFSNARKPRADAPQQAGGAAPAPFRL